MMSMHLEEMKNCPAVFAVKNAYQIMIPFNCEAILWVMVNGKKYCDHMNGAMRSLTDIHRVIVPMSELDKAKEYTVCYRCVIDRKPYFPEFEDVKSITYKFHPVGEDNITISHLSDTHGEFEHSSKSAQSMNSDFLVLNGDIQNFSGKAEDFGLIYDFCEAVTGGEKPCIYSRGNHDMRGIYAEKLHEYTPTDNGNPYFTFRLGGIWGMVIDCGEDKCDTSVEYGGTIACHDFREKETEFIKNVITNSKNEYEADGVNYRIVIAHKNFAHVGNKPFDIEQDLYSEWVNMINDNIEPQLLIAGHEHVCKFYEKESEYNTFGIDCAAVIASEMISENDKIVDFIGTSIQLNSKNAEVKFVNSEGETIEKHKIAL